MENERKVPPAMNIYREGCELLLELNEAEAGQVIQAAVRYYFDGDEPQDLSRYEGLVFSQIKHGLDFARNKYENLCRKKQEAANKRWSDE